MPEGAPAPAEPGEHAAPSRPPLAAMLGMAALFVLGIALAMVVAPLYRAEVGPIFEDPQDVGNAGLYLVLVVAFTAFILLIARRRLLGAVKAIILGAVLLTIAYVAGPLLSVTFRPLLAEAGLAEAVGWGLALVLATLLTYALHRRPEWWVVDAVGVAVAAGAGAYFGISFGLLPALVLLAAFAAYDAVAVYRTKHMIDLADAVMELRLPLMLIVPKKRGYSFLREEARLKERLEKGEEREALFLGLGDVVIPCVLVVSALEFLEPSRALAGVPGNLIVSLATLLGALAGYGLLMLLVARGKAHAGLPSLNGGAALGFLLALLPLYGLAPLLPA